MIKKITSIKGIGSFKDLNFQYPVSENWSNREFKPVNVIYAENGMGKTTLTMILNSLKGEPDMLHNKKTFYFKGDQEVEIILENNLNGSPKINYKNGMWSENYPDIEIFDIHFVNDNVYTGTEIQAEHRKNLFGITIGKEGKILTDIIGNIKNEINELNSKNIFIKNQIIQQSNGLIKETDIDNLVSVVKNDIIQGQIDSKNQEILAFQNIEIVREKPVFKEIKITKIDIDFLDLYESLNKTLKSISEEYLQIFTKHTTHLNDTDAITWLKQGVKLMKEDSCPFCAQSLINPSEIIESYQQYFNEEYKIHQDKLLHFKQLLDAFDETEIFLSIQNTLNQNFELTTFWKTYISDLQINNIILEKESSDLKSFMGTIKQVIQTKLSDRNSNYPTLEIDEISKILEVVNTKIQTYNTSLSWYNSSINQVKEKLEKKDLTTLQTELRKFEIIKYRSQETTDTLCLNYQENNKQKKILDSEKTKKSETLKIYTASIFKKYGESINKYLGKFSNNIKIENLKSQYKGSSTEPFAEYHITVDNQKVAFNEKGSGYSMKYVLSEGDKSAIALAFFFAKLAVDSTNLGNKIIVFDDPISSFDSNRKTETLQRLSDLSKKCKQLFLLTHNINFAHQFYEKNQKCLCLRIQTDNNSSQITDFDIETENMSGFAKNRISLEKYLENGGDDLQKRNTIRCIRPLIEGILRIKYPDKFIKGKWLKDFLHLIDNAAQNDNIYRLKEMCSQLEDLNEYSKKYHHESNSNADNEPINENELRNYVLKTLKVSYHI
jgi:wobble nucleotide-excising tRNase